MRISYAKALEAFVDYIHYNRRFGIFRSRKKKEIDVIDQEIHIRDLVLRYDDMFHSQESDIPPDMSHSQGESDYHDNSLNKPESERLRSHIQSLFNLTNEDHRANYCKEGPQGKYQIKAGKENCITRLSMNEFSLYTSQPLSYKDFHELYADIYKMAESLEPNAHVHLSSFAVLDKAGKAVRKNNSYNSSERFDCIIPFSMECVLSDIDLFKLFIRYFNSFSISFFIYR